MMKRPNLFLPLLVIWILSVSCGQQKDTKIDTNEKETLILETFSDLPPEIDGCGCYFSIDEADFKEDKYIFVNDYAQTSFLKLNGAMVLFTQTDFKEGENGKVNALYKADGYEMTIEVIDGKSSGEESSFKSGTIKVNSTDGRSVSKGFFGECGC